MFVFEKTGDTAAITLAPAKYITREEYIISQALIETTSVLCCLRGGKQVRLKLPITQYAPTS